MIVYPAILSSDISGVMHRILLFLGRVDGIHIDFADGVFVSNKSILPSDLGRLPDGFFEAHLMVVEPEKYIRVCQQVGFSRVLVHIDSFSHCDYEQALSLQDFVHVCGMEFGVVFQRGVSVVESALLCQFDYAMVMTVELGFSGQPFCEEQLLQIAALRRNCPHIPIAADGHVDTITAVRIKASGATHLVSNSFLSGPAVFERYNALKEI